MRGGGERPAYRWPVKENPQFFPLASPRFPLFPGKSLLKHRRRCKIKQQQEPLKVREGLFSGLFQGGVLPVPVLFPQPKPTNPPNPAPACCCCSSSVYCCNSQTQLLQNFNVNLLHEHFFFPAFCIFFVFLIFVIFSFFPIYISHVFYYYFFPSFFFFFWPCSWALPLLVFVPFPTCSQLSAEFSCGRRLYICLYIVANARHIYVLYRYSVCVCGGP